MNLGAIKQRYSGLSEPLRSERFAELAVVVLAVVIVLQILLFTARYLGGVASSSIAPAADSLLVESVKDAGSVTSSQSLMMQARPVFWASRRPLEDAVLTEEQLAEAGATTSARSLKGFTITGVLAAGEQGQAIVNYKGQRRRVPVGGDVDGWTLVELTASEAIFVSGPAREVYALARVSVPEGAVAQAPPPERDEPVGDDAQAAGSPSRPPRAPRREASMQQQNNNSKNDTSGSLSLGG